MLDGVPVNDMESLIQGLASAVIHCDQNRENLPAEVEKSRQKLFQHFDSTRYDEVIAKAYDTALYIKHDQNNTKH